MDKIEVINKLEEEYKKEGVLYIQSDGIKINTIEDFIQVFFGNLNQRYKTFNNPGLKGFEQCKRGANRSIGDIYRILLSFVPDASLLDLILTMVININLNIKINYIHEDGYLYFLDTFKCKDINKRVYFIGARPPEYNYSIPTRNNTFNNPYYFTGQDSDTKDELGFTIKDYLDLAKEYAREDTTIGV